MVQRVLENLVIDSTLGRFAGSSGDRAGNAAAGRPEADDAGLRV